MKLRGEGEYNLNALKKIKVTDSYLDLNQDVRGCQNNVDILNCTTRNYIDTHLRKCGCLPFNLRQIHNVREYS